MHHQQMTFTELETTRDLVCAALVADCLTKDQNELIQALAQIPIRDGFLRYLFDNPSSRVNACRNLATLLKNCVPHEQVVIGTVLAGCYWLDADFENTRQALDLALAADSTYSLARLLDVALTHSVPAAVWADSLAAVSPEQCLHGAA